MTEPQSAPAGEAVSRDQAEAEVAAHLAGQAERLCRDRACRQAGRADPQYITGGDAYVGWYWTERIWTGHHPTGHLLGLREDATGSGPRGRAGLVRFQCTG
jgi:hypothetical protein